MKVTNSGLTGWRKQQQVMDFLPSRAFTPTRWLHDGDTVTLGKHTLQVRHCPGHTPGHVVFYSPEIKRAFVGDVLFAGSIGRTRLSTQQPPRLDRQHHATLVAYGK
jgi:glyoxylase-like metal-dependent hydrolase (beta-lactamase superfamily II)